MGVSVQASIRFDGVRGGGTSEIVVVLKLAWVLNVEAGYIDSGALLWGHYQHRGSMRHVTLV